ncbi:LysR substrate-binding domain-containing protein [Phenylobacterium sp.]|jgi:DNA-binding transcriptional LysR family regulator|uniref:LysR substrate-binding domain-containing protein n=1 Tax=Phenylobacterium sp. TaxID=1871053 RepID=UPI002F41FF45
MRFTLKQLVVFEAVGRLGSVSRAAAEIPLSQSAASTALGELENALGLPLFNRRGRRIGLNENGRRLMVQARSLLSQAADIDSVTRPAPASLQGVLRVAATPQIAKTYLAEACAGFLASHPQVRIALAVHEASQVLDQVANIGVDLGFVDVPCNRSGLVVEQIGEDRLEVVASPAHPFARMGRIGLDQLRSASWVLRESGASVRSPLTMALGQADPVLRIALEANDDEVLKRAVIAGAGLGCMSARALRAELVAGGLVALDTDLALRTLLIMVTAQGLNPGRLAPAFAAFARPAFEQASCR